MAFFEVVLVNADLHAAGVSSRDVIEDLLAEALDESGLGEVTGGGGGSGVSTIDIECENDRNVSAALKLIVSILRDNGAPSSTTIHEREPRNLIHKL